MNLPAGKPLKTGLDNASTDFIKLLDDLRFQRFSGCLYLTVRSTGIEEGTLLFDEGKIVGSSYDYLKHGRTFNGEKAFVRILNASAAQYGVVDVYALDAEQVRLALAVNDDVVFVPKQEGLRRIRIEKFSLMYEEEAKEKAAEQKENPLDKYKMGSLKNAEAPQENVLKKLEESASNG